MCISLYTLHSEIYEATVRRPLSHIYSLVIVITGVLSSLSSISHKSHKIRVLLSELLLQCVSTL